VVLPDPTQDTARYLSVRYSMPAWLVEIWMQTYGTEAAVAACAAYDRQAPTTLRVNTLKTTREALIERLGKTGFVVTPHPTIPDALTVLDGPPPARSKFFTEGHFLLSDMASMLPPHLLEPQPGDRVLDLCAAPGVKTTHLAQLAGGQTFVVALDVHANKLGLIRENAGRLGLDGIAVACGDGTRPPVASVFDRVLLDAPCSGLGTLRRKPDLKWRVTPETPARMAALQGALLRSAVDLCKNGGVIVYSVCTFSPEETDAVVDACVAEGRVEPEDGPEWMSLWKTQKGRYRTSPQDAELDGFFLTRLRKAF
ncbi:MAG: rRNA (cytosine967-C5)-methyltransferase, partial [Candidatus Hydrogenedentes bacterium]|nr:rRNA (cytosine967-C5)-methyltransferase [Candidatus Hydrogenedentota bacterium]